MSSQDRFTKHLERLEEEIEKERNDLDVLFTRVEERKAEIEVAAAEAAELAAEEAEAAAEAAELADGDAGDDGFDIPPEMDVPEPEVPMLDGRPIADIMTEIETRT